MAKKKGVRTAAKSSPAKAEPRKGVRIKKRRFKGDGPVAGSRKRPVLVEIPGSVGVVVKAESNDEAWELYKQVAGVIGTDRKPRFSRPGPDVSVNEHGIVVDKLNTPILADASKPDSGEGDWDVDEEEV